MKKEPRGIHDTRDLFQQLLNEYKLPLETFAVAVNGKVEDVIAFLDDSTDPNINIEKSTHLATTISNILSITYIDNDERIIAVIEALKDKFYISLESIALLCEIELSVLEQFMRSPNSVSYEIKYRVAVVVLFLLFVLCKETRK